MNRNQTRPSLAISVARTVDRALSIFGRIREDGGVTPLTYQELSQRTHAGIGWKKLGALRRNEILEPLAGDIVHLAHVFMESIEAMFDREDSDFLLERDGVAWRLAGLPRNARSRACQTASAMLLEGEGPAEIRAALQLIYADRGISPPTLEDHDLLDFAASGFAMGLVRFEEFPKGEPCANEDVGLASALLMALEKDAEEHGVRTGTPNEVRVVKNLAHQAFGYDPAAPHQIARVGHAIVARHFERHQTIYTIGFSGGVHCATFVRAAGPESSPFADMFGTQRVTMVPLTLEPFDNHALPMADVVVGEMVDRASCLLGARRAKGETFQSFGYLVDEQIDRREHGALDSVRRHYRDLDIAIYGCGDLENDGWLECALRRVSLPASARPLTDICLNLLDENGASIKLPGGREFVGISQSDIQRVVERPGRLALLLTSGHTKGRPIVAANRAGCLDTLVCDQAAARAALSALGAG